MGRWAQQRRRGGGVPPPQPPVNERFILRVVNEDGGGFQATWIFDADPLTVENPGPFEVQILGIWQLPLTSVINVDGVLCTYAAFVDDGTPWRVVTPPSDLTFAGGGNLVIPQAGFTEPP